MNTEKILDDFANRNQYSTWKEVIKDKQSISFEAKEFEDEIKEMLFLTQKQTIDDVLKILRKWHGNEWDKLSQRYLEELTKKIKELK